MTTIAYLDPVGGLAGDMLLAALLDAGADRAVVDDTVEALGLDGVTVEIERVDRGGLDATRARVVVAERASARSATTLLRIIAEAPLPVRVGARATEALRRLADVEAAIHGVPDPDEVVLHELGGDDTLV